MARDRIHSFENMHRLAELAFAAAKPIADEHGVGLVVVLVDATEQVRYLTGLGPTMTAGALSRCAGLYDAKAFVPSEPAGGVSVTGTFEVVSDPPGAGGGGAAPYPPGAGGGGAAPYPPGAGGGGAAP